VKIKFDIPTLFLQSANIPTLWPANALRNAGKSLVLLLVLAASLASGRANAQTATPVNVPTWRYDNTHSGSNTQETLLTPANVNNSTFGKLFSRSVDGYVYAQPLYVSGLMMQDGLVHNVLFVATQHDSVYAFDADTNGGTNALPLWQASMLSTAYGAAAGATTVPNSDLGTSDVVPEIGITSTPVIDLATQTMYLVAATKENGNYLQRVHAINIITGAEVFPGPSAPITATVSGTGNGSSGGSLPFSPEWQMNRVALDLFNGTLYVGFGSHGDNGPWHGWLMAFSEQTLTQTGYICLSPNGYGNGVWGAGAGLPIDTEVNPNGRLFLSTGNGDYTSYPPLDGSVDYGDSLLQIDLTGGGVTPADVFTPFNQAKLASGDTDQGSGGVLMLPDQPGAHPHELIQVGKEGRILVLNRDNMGGYAPGGTYNTNALQDITGQTGGLWSTPAYWNGHVFFWGDGSSLKRFELTNGVLSSTSSSASTVTSQFPGASPVVSSNGTTNGVVWAIRTDAYNSNGSSILYAFDATNLKTPLYESDSNAARDDAGPATKFAVPVITNGKVYTGAAYQVNVYGLLNGLEQAAPPAISPNGGSLSAPQQVMLSTTTPNSTIYYTTDGSLPTMAAPVYTGPFTITTDTTVQAITSAQNYLQSPVSTAVFTFASQVPPPSFTPAAGTYTSPQPVTITDSLLGAAIYYTTDGSTPTPQSTLYNGPITVANTTNLNAIAISAPLSPSNVVSSAYSINIGGTGINFGSGFAEVNGLTLNGSAINSDDSRLQLTNGGSNQAGSFFGNTPLNITSFVNDFAFQLSDAQADGFTFTIQNVGPTALGPSGGELGYGSSGGIQHSVAIKFDLYSNSGEGPNSTGIFQNGAVPTTPAIDLTSSGINLHSGDSMSVHMTYDGTNLVMTITDPVANATFTHTFPINIPQVIGSNSAYVGFTGGTGGETASQKILTWTFVSGGPAVTPTPVINPNGGTFTSPQPVTISDATSNAVIYYTVDGSTPSPATSQVYTVPITVGNGTTIVSAIAIGPGASQSAVTAATFSVTSPVAATPNFTPAGGTYLAGQTVSLSDTTAGASIYYTTDGSAPGLTSNLYSSAIVVTGTETINAVAIASGFLQSPVATATYTIQTPGQTIDYSSGFPNSTGLALNGSAQIDSKAKGLEVTDGNGDEAASAWATTPVNVSAFTTDFTFQMLNPNADGFTFAIQSVGTTALGPYGGGLGYGAINGTGIPKSVAFKFDIYSNSGEGKDSIGVYTDGAAPSLPATDLTSTGIVLTSGDTFHAHLVYNGTTLTVTITDTNTSASYTGNFPVNIAAALGTTAGYAGFTGGTGGLTVKTEIYTWTFTSAGQSVTSEPTFTPAPGTYSGPLSVSLSDLTSNSTIYYTVDGSQPSHSSAVYSSPIQVSGVSLTITAFASASGLTDSPVVIGTYNITSLTVPTITFSVSNRTYSTSTFTVAATSNSSGAITYTVVSGPATISGSTVTMTGAGTVVIMASQAAAGGYSAGTQNATFTIAPLAPTISFQINNKTYGVTPFTVAATSNSSGAFSYSVVSGPATISGSIVTVTGVGTVVIKASQAASNAYTSGTKNATFTVAKATPTITFTVAKQTYGVAPFQVSATSTSPGAITYSVVSGPATISGSNVTITGTGTVVLKASQAATANYAAGTKNASFAVAAAAPTISFSVANQTYGTAPFQVSATSNSLGAIKYSVVSGPAKISGSTVTLTGKGTVVLKASQAADNPYTSGTQQATFSVM
jgi:hypothetical protein